MKGKIIILILALTSSYLLRQFIIYPQPSVSEDLRVIRVIDGDTIVVSDNERIRLLGINAPEKGESYSEEATEMLQDLVDEKEIRLERDRTDKDKYGRLLRYVYVDDVFVNLQLLRNGYAVLDVEYPLIYEKEFEDAEEFAKSNKLGLWSLN